MDSRKRKFQFTDTTLVFLKKLAEEAEKADNLTLPSIDDSTAIRDFFEETPFVEKIIAQEETGETWQDNLSVDIEPIINTTDEYSTPPFMVPNFLFWQPPVSITIQTADSTKIKLTPEVYFHAATNQLIEPEEIIYKVKHEKTNYHYVLRNNTYEIVISGNSLLSRQVTILEDDKVRVLNRQEKNSLIYIKSPAPELGYLDWKGHKATSAVHHQKGDLTFERMNTYRLQGKVSETHSTIEEIPKPKIKFI